MFATSLPACGVGRAEAPGELPYFKLAPNEWMMGGMLRQPRRHRPHAALSHRISMGLAASASRRTERNSSPESIPLIARRRCATGLNS